MTLKQIKAIQAIADLQEYHLLEIYLDYDISHRGGTLGFSRKFISETFNIPEEQLTKRVGCYVNYLGGGIRDKIRTSDTHLITNKTKKKKIEEFCLMCKRIYLELEDDYNHEEYPDGDINWDAMATNSIRRHV